MNEEDIIFPEDILTQEEIDMIMYLREQKEEMDERQQGYTRNIAGIL